MKNKNLFQIIAIVALILATIFLAMQTSGEINWNLFDFVIAGILLLAAGLSYWYFTQKRKDLAYRILIGAIILLIFAIIWLELAIGIFGTFLSGN